MLFSSEMLSLSVIVSFSNSCNKISVPVTAETIENAFYERIEMIENDFLLIFLEKWCRFKQFTPIFFPFQYSGDNF